MFLLLYMVEILTSGTMTYIDVLEKKMKMTAKLRHPLLTQNILL